MAVTRDEQMVLDVIRAVKNLGLGAQITTDENEAGEVRSVEVRVKLVKDGVVRARLVGLTSIAA